MAGDTKERLALLRRAKKGDQKALVEVIEKYVNLVKKFASRYKTSGLEFEDLVQEGLIGLLKAIDTFDPSTGFMFSTYSSRCMWNEIIKAASRKGDSDHSNVGCKAFFRAGRARTALLKRGVEPTPELVAKEIGVRVSAVMALLPHAEVFEEDWRDERDPEDEIAERSERRYQLDLVLKAMERLNPRAREVIRRRFLLDDEREETLEAIGRCVGVCRERVRQIEKMSLEKIRLAVRRAQWA